MIGRYAVIEKGKVANVVDADAALARAKGWVRADRGVAKGDAYDDQAGFTPAVRPTPIPTTTPSEAARLRLAAKPDTDFTPIELELIRALGLRS